MTNENVFKIQSSLFKSEAPSLGWALEPHAKLPHPMHSTSRCIVEGKYETAHLMFKNVLKQNSVEAKHFTTLSYDCVK